MMLRMPLRILLVLSLIPLAVLGARKMADFDAVCPLFGHQFTAQSLVKDEISTTFDSDFCKRTRNESPYILAVWTCPYCFFSAYQADFRGSIDARFRDMKLRAYPVEAEKIEQADIFVATKYFNAETYYKMAGRDPRFLADLTLRGSWACRVFDIPNPEELHSLHEEIVAGIPGAARMRSPEILNLEVERHIAQLLESGEVPEGREDVYRYLRADALRQAGDHRTARKIFDDLIQEQRLPTIYLRAAAQKGLLCAKEAEFQEKTLEYLVAAKEEIDEDERSETIYLMAELSRRLGRFEEARALYDQAAARNTTSESLRDIIRRQADRLPAPGEAPTAG
jgi:tetratricopeptide (TPR) repeat protein